MIEIQPKKHYDLMPYDEGKQQHPRMYTSCNIFQFMLLFYVKKNLMCFNIIIYQNVHLWFGTFSKNDVTLQ